ncbi:hypothetical protein LOD99_6042 [Oopsacas minuta]|uniref:PH domain-containing protein n=1 Tax=Oopsacas minuta TaxID=111878 RepID=A0AAV7JPN4_9METZ|nr:hypothetical protein LOD99_6042 [Oopsacas minuta]
MNKDRSGSAFFCQTDTDEQYEIKKQGYVCIQERKVFHHWKKVWLVFKQIEGSTPRIVFDAYSNESQFRSGYSPKYTFNLTGTVTPVVICQQNHKQVRHMFAVCPPGSRYVFECDSQFGLESWVEELNECLFPRTTSIDHLVDNSLTTSMKLTGSIRNRTKSNSMNDISKIGAEPPTEVPVAPPLPPHNNNRKPTVKTTVSSPTHAIIEEVVSKYKVEVEVSTLTLVPKGLCVVIVRNQDIKLCHAVTLETQVTWLITHIREFKLTNDDKLIITSGHRSFTGYGQIRFQGDECRPLYYKVKQFVMSKSQLTKTPSAQPRSAVTLPERKLQPLPIYSSCVSSVGDMPNNHMTSPPESPNISRPLPDIPSATIYSTPNYQTSSVELEYSRLRHDDWNTIPKTKHQNNSEFTQPIDYSEVPDSKNTANFYPKNEDGYNTIQHNKEVTTNPFIDHFPVNVLDSFKHKTLIAHTKDVTNIQAPQDNRYSCVDFLDLDITPIEIRKTKSLISSGESSKHKTQTGSCEETVNTLDDYEPDITFTNNVAYVKNTSNLVSPYLITKPELPPKPKNY